MSSAQKSAFAEKLSQAVEKRTAEDAREAVIEMHSRLYEKEAAYTNLILLGGYVGAFAIWHSTISLMTPRGIALVALLLGLSLFSFVFFEVYKVLRGAIIAFRWRHTVTSDLSPSELIQRVRKLEVSLSRDPFIVLLPLWCVVMFFAIGGAIGGVIILMYSAVAGILGLPKWP
jgi:hypothetical protein